MKGRRDAPFFIAVQGNRTRELQGGDLQRRFVRLQLYKSRRLWDGYL